LSISAAVSSPPLVNTARMIMAEGQGVIEPTTATTAVMPTMQPSTTLVRCHGRRTFLGRTDSSSVRAVM
jgi:hypothetical protein